LLNRKTQLIDLIGIKRFIRKMISWLAMVFWLALQKRDWSPITEFILIVKIYIIWKIEECFEILDKSEFWGNRGLENNSIFRSKFCAFLEFSRVIFLRKQYNCCMILKWLLFNCLIIVPRADYVCIFRPCST
jgi:hypothetical protein